ncbi:MAG TPA: four helix bundle protein [Vicinamibacterales bacterium]|nr:four helix bundle protein [Vicinamibacterales bacterium]
MSRDYRKLKVFTLADHLVLETYRRAAFSVAANIVEGSARYSTREWLNFVSIAAGSATEACYLAHVAGRLRFIETREATSLEGGYSELAAGLRAMSRALREKPMNP